MAKASNNLLPKSEGEFAKKEFWEKFFKSRGSKAFEWYGEYTDLVGVLVKYVKPKDNILVVGCGNSELSADLYDLHKCTDITNIDISSVVIRQMQEKHCKSGQRPGMCYLVSDVCNLDSDPNLTSKTGFSCVLDKGTLDAMCSGGPDSFTLVRTMFSQIEAVLRVTGRYICITLAQAHIVHALVDYFVRESPYWLIRCHIISQGSPVNGPPTGKGDSNDDEASFPLPVFVLVFTKFVKSPNFRVIVEVQNDWSSDKLTRLQGPEELAGWIEGQQNSALVRSSLGRQDESKCSFLCPKTGQVFCVCYVINSATNQQETSNTSQQKRSGKKKQTKATKQSSVLPYGVFIVPIGGHNDSPFTSAPSRRELCGATNTSRLLLVLLNPRLAHLSGLLIQDSLNAVAVQFAPEGLDTDRYKIPFMSSGSTYPLSELHSSTVPNLGPCLVEKGEFVGRQLVFPESTFRPIQLTQKPICSRDDHIAVWTDLICATNPEIKSLFYYGFPKQVAGIGSREKTIQSYLGKRYDHHQNELNSLWSQFFSSPKSSITLNAMPEIDSIDFLVFDPLSIDPEIYSKEFSQDTLSELMASLNTQGVALLILENNKFVSKDEVIEALTQVDLSNILLTYPVSDQWLGNEDSPAQVIIATRSQSTITKDALKQSLERIIDDLEASSTVHKTLRMQTLSELRQHL